MIVKISHNFVFFLLILVSPNVSGQYDDGPLVNQKIEGYKGIWFTLQQFYEYGVKYSGGLGTYTVKHRSIAIYSAEAKKTFLYMEGLRPRQKNILIV